MKLNLVLVLIGALSAPIAFAQELEAPTAARSPAEPATAETSESPAGKSSAKQYPTPGVTASPAASASASPTKPNAATASAKPTQASGPIVAKGTAEQQVRQVEDAYPAATMSHNIALVEPFLADDFVFTDSRGRVMNKRATLGEMKKDTDTYTTAKNTDLKLRPVDRDVYVVTGVYHEAGKDKSGKPFDRRYRFTDTVANRGGKWLVVASHVSTLSPR